MKIGNTKNEGRDNEIENKITVEKKSMKPRVGSLKRSAKLTHLLLEWPRKERRFKLLNQKWKRGHQYDLMEIKRIRIEYYEQFYLKN